MSTVFDRRHLCLLLGLCAAACNHGRQIPRPYAAPSALDAIEHLHAEQSRVQAYVAVTNTIDYWLNDERIKAEMHVMGERGAKIRLNVMNPQTDTTAADLACNGTTFSFIDYTNECQLEGICDRNAIGRILRLNLEPDDFLLLVAGSSPIISEATGTVTWDEKKGTWVVDLVSPDGERQQIILDGDDQNGGRWELLESTVWDRAGNIEWKVTNKNFVKVLSEAGLPFQLPSRTKFVQPRREADVVIEWGTRHINVPPQSHSKYELSTPPGLARCGN